MVAALPNGEGSGAADGLGPAAPPEPQRGRPCRDMARSLRGARRPQQDLMKPFSADSLRSAIEPTLE
jgi:hypothetical protein